MIRQHVSATASRSAGVRASMLSMRTNLKLELGAVYWSQGPVQSQHSQLGPWTRADKATLDQLTKLVGGSDLPNDVKTLAKDLINSAATVGASAASQAPPFPDFSPGRRPAKRSLLTGHSCADTGASRPTLVACLRTYRGPSQRRAPQRSPSSGRAGVFHPQGWPLACRARRRGRSLASCGSRGAASQLRHKSRVRVAGRKIAAYKDH